MDPAFPFDQAVSLLPLGLRQIALMLPRAEQASAEELRLRTGQPMSVTFPDGERAVSGSPAVRSEDLRSVMEFATHSSVHTALERIQHGFVTVRGGHRVGLCGTAVTKSGLICGLNTISSLNIRIARQINGASDQILRQLLTEHGLCSVLILSPPGAGKTTLLRDMIRSLSSGTCGCALRVGVVDERGELAAVYHGSPQLDLGPHTDIMDGCGKADGLMILLRGMNPQILAVDEITAPEDIRALETAVGCGVILLATAHGRNTEDLKRRPLYAELLRRNIFQKAILIDCGRDGRRYRLEELSC